MRRKFGPSSTCMKHLFKANSSLGRVPGINPELYTLFVRKWCFPVTGDLVGSPGYPPVKKRKKKKKKIFKWVKNPTLRY
jgi:hypothetical protein